MSASPAALRLLTFRLGAESYALGLEAVEEVASGGRLRRRADLPGALCGEILLREGAAPVLDLRRSLGLEEGPVGVGKILVSRAAGPAEIGLLVDRVHGVRDVPPAALVSPPRYFEAAAEHLRGIVHLDDGLTLVLDAERLLTAEEREGLESWEAAGSAREPRA